MQEINNHLEALLDSFGIQLWVVFTNKFGITLPEELQRLVDDSVHAWREHFKLLKLDPALQVEWC